MASPGQIDGKATAEIQTEQSHRYVIEVPEVLTREQVADRIDGKATAEIQTEQSHRYVIEVPAELTREQWIQKYSPSPPIGTSTPSDESLVLSNE